MSKATAAGGAGVGPSRRTWDVEEYTSKAREKDREDKERAQQNEERIRKGQKPLPRTSKLDSLPQPTSHLQPRSQPLDLDKDVGKTLLVDNSGDSRRGAGYYCEVCRKTCKDSIGYLDHINGRDHLRRLGQTTHVARSTVEQVRARIQLLRSQTSSSSSSNSAKEYDFLERVKAIADAEREKKEERKRRKKEERERKEREREEERRKEMGGGGVEDEAMMSMMGFGGFGSSKK
ncbi:hypothetical protein BCV69DRAFT_280046 [Microstroma glucosiphilum]|uniref:U1-type domain-containing protein n=1 Tax=Pseudomicrostroma glucosiphilum TaxID=1684307 RepID=A0A316UGU1_9BASI|nr:hypothetical protein BCV69DRAFT_280046 [Pseudomicrostroma glucosiphilum]PWN24144.1 hypothetical protein BCV69DRAFT_280046 [Pseudomicrostroma glucosiphilum]